MQNQTIFFSYSRQDSEKFALKLASDLREAGVNIWIDQLNIEVGPPWDRQIGKALKSCQRFLIILSPESMESENVMDEVSYAKDENKEIIPILYKKCHVDFRLRRLQHVDCTTDYDKGLTKLLATLKVQALQSTDNIDDVESKDKEVYYDDVYISYAWGGESEEIADELETVLLSNNILAIRDKAVMDYTGNIKTFKDNINQCNGVIVLISDKYLKSIYCMSELMEFYENEKFEDLIFPIVLDDANIFEVEGILAYKGYWKAKRDYLDTKLVGAEASKTLIPEYELFEKIHDYIDKVVDILTNMNALTPDIHRSNKFEAITNIIKERLSQTP